MMKQFPAFILGSGPIKSITTRHEKWKSKRSSTILISHALIHSPASTLEASLESDEVEQHQWRSQTNEVAWASFGHEAPRKIPHLLVIHEGYSLN